MAVATSSPGVRQMMLEHLVLDFNGTLACDGVLAEGVRDLLVLLSRNLEIHVVTADTHGNAASACQDLPCQLVVLPEGEQDAAKLDYLRTLGAGRVVCIGNGRNDRLMVGEAVLLKIWSISCTKGVRVNKDFFPRI